MKSFLLLLLLIPLPALAQEKEGYCNEGNKKLKQELKSKTFEEWVGIRQTMCEEAYMQYKEGTIYPLMILKCSVDNWKWTLDLIDKYQKEMEELKDENVKLKRQLVLRSQLNK